MRHRRRQTKSLFDRRARGGVIGGAGYNFQDAYIITALPAWLSNPAFRSFIKEGFEDVDARFDDGRDAWTWHYQLKDHPVAASELREALVGFAVSAGRTDLNATRFILGCTGLAPNVASLWKLIKEFRGARKIHPEIALGATRKDLEAQIVKLKLADWADLIIDRVEIDHENPALRDTEPSALMERFRGRFITLPLYHHEEPAVLDRLFMGLMVPINKAIRLGITREEIRHLVEDELATATKGPATVVYLHGWLRQQYDVPADVELDWTRDFDHATLRVAPPEIWRDELLPALGDVRARFDGDGHRRSIWLRARAPLSAGIAFGHAFAEAAGYSITVQQPTPGASGAIQYWRTDSVADGAEQLEIREVEGEATGAEVAVGVGITDDPQPKVEEYLSRAGLKVRASLYLSPPGGPSPSRVNERNVGGVATALKRGMRGFVDRQGARLIHLFYFGPLGLAVLLGQKLNGLADIQCYERNKTTGYTPSCRLSA
jgi:hypothetical protein